MSFYNITTFQNARYDSNNCSKMLKSIYYLVYWDTEIQIVFIKFKLLTLFLYVVSM